MVFSEISGIYKKCYLPALVSSIKNIHLYISVANIYLVGPNHGMVCKLRTGFLNYVVTLDSIIGPT